MMPTSRACSSSRCGCDGPVVEVGGRAEGGDALDLRVGGRRRRSPARRRCRTRPATRRSRRSSSRRWPTAAPRSSSQPRARSCPRTRRSRGRRGPWPASPSRRRSGRPAPGSADAATAVALHVAGVAVGEHDRGRVDGVGPHRRPGQVRGEQVPARREAELHALAPATPASASAGWPGARPVAAVAGLGEGVGPEAEVGLGRHQLVDHVLVGRRCRGRRRAGCACRRGSGGARSGSGRSMSGNLSADAERGPHRRCGPRVRRSLVGTGAASPRAGDGRDHSPSTGPAVAGEDSPGGPASRA